MMKSKRHAVNIVIVVMYGILATTAHADDFSFDGEGGAKKSFSLTGGQYELYLIAKYPARGYSESGTRECFFAGMLERISPTYEKWTLSPGIPVSEDNIFPLKIDRQVTLPAGQYNLFVASSTDCWWNFTLVKTREAAPAPAATKPAGTIGPVKLLKQMGSVKIVSQTASVQQPVRLFAPYTVNDPLVRLMGFCLIDQGDKAFFIDKLQVGVDEAKHPIFYVDVTLSEKQKQFLGKSTAKFVTSLGTSTGEFTLTK